MSGASATTLAFDLGGTKLAAALVADDRVLERAERATRRDAGPAGWVEDMAALAARWRGHHGGIGLAVSGRVREGCWRSLNRRTLDGEDDYPLVDALAERTGCPVHAANDAQAAAWGEHRHGAGRGTRDMAFLSVSTGIGGGIVADGRLLAGANALAGHVGQIPCGDPPEPLENACGGRAIAASFGATDAKAVFAAAARGEREAEAVIERAAARIAWLCGTLQAVLDPERIVVGGGVGLAAGFLERVQSVLAPPPDPFRATLVRAALGVDAGLIGVADLAVRSRDATN